MGRALFSTIYRSAPVVHEEPEPQPNDIPPYATWSPKNPFDPDSDEFFLDAEYEAFIAEPDPRTFREQEDQQDHSPDPGHGTSPMAVGDDPANYIPRQPVRWHATSQRFSITEESEGPWRTVGAMAVEGGPQHVDRDLPYTGQDPEIIRAFLERADATFTPPHRPSDDASSERSHPPFPALSMPIPIPQRASTPSSGSDSSSPLPSTPPPHPYSLSSVSTPPHPISVSMSPPPTVSPRLYSWNMSRHAASPGSPSTGRGPLTNSTARTSFSRLPRQVPERLIENFAF